MTDISPLQRSDPADIGGFALLGRLRDDERGPVFLARDAGGSHVEITWLRGGADGFGRVAAALTAARAPSLARVLATGVLDGRPYLVGEHVPGRPLRDAVAAGGAMTGTALHRLAIAMASALVGLHQNGVTHGDLHPGTVFVGDDGVRLTGYGLAGLADAGPPAPTRALGRVAYSAPEQVAGSGGGEAADVFAWAATLLYAATGSPPFEGGSTAETVSRVARHEPDLAVLEEHLRPVVGACLAEDPAGRPDSGEVLLRLVGHSTQSLVPDVLPAPPPTADGTGRPADGPAGPAGAAAAG
ncbi:protein kinase domain-containing protein, partial [Nonomuraea sp. SBT364]|uniref:protein kinase domain-containing protein n=1 Tax=Nonomuraea sp. SBT364 TaxID=1580530 RepID=UPI000A79C424